MVVITCLIFYDHDINLVNVIIIKMCSGSAFYLCFDQL